MLAVARPCSSHDYGQVWVQYQQSFPCNLFRVGGVVRTWKPILLDWLCITSIVASRPGLGKPMGDIKEARSWAFRIDGVNVRCGDHCHIPVLESCVAPSHLPVRRIFAQCASLCPYAFGKCDALRIEYLLLPLMIQ